MVNRNATDREIAEETMVKFFSEMLKSGRADVFSGNKPTLFEMSDQLAGSRVLDGRFAADPMTMAIPKGRDLGMA